MAEKSKRRSRGISKIKQTEITKAAKGMIAAGVSVCGVEVNSTTGKFRVLTGEPDKGGDLDKWLAEKKSVLTT